MLRQGACVANIYEHTGKHALAHTLRRAFTTCDAFSMSPHTATGVLIKRTHTHTHTVEVTNRDRNPFVLVSIRHLHTYTLLAMTETTEAAS